MTNFKRVSTNFWISNFQFSKILRKSNKNIQGWPPNTPQSIPDHPQKFWLFLIFFDFLECSNQLKHMMINMIIKIVIFELFTQVPGQTTIIAGFAAFFYADSCRRYVKSSFLSPFQDHFCFPQKNSSTSTSMVFHFLILFNIFPYFVLLAA